MKIKIDNLGEYLKKKRKEAKMTLSDISSAVNLSPQYISRIENGSSVPSLETIYKLSSIFDFKMEDMWEFSDVELNKNESFDIEDLFKSDDKTSKLYRKHRLGQ